MAAPDSAVTGRSAWSAVLLGCDCWVCCGVIGVSP
jgi:hypothetical protein